MLKAILFDLDGTLLPMDQDTFVNAYFTEILKKFVPLGYDGKKLTKNLWEGTQRTPALTAIYCPNPK